MLEMENVNSGYGKFVVLKGVDVRVGKGEIVALIGPNGAGKSTVLKSVFGIADVGSGRILLKGREITGLKTHELIRKGVSYVPQGKINFSDLTVLENLEIGDLGRDGQATREKLEKVFAKFPVLEEKKNDLAFSLSGGQQQILALGRGLMQSPSLMLLDEPSLGLSPVLQKELFRTLVELRDETGISLLVVEQNAKKAIEIADRTYLLENGKIVLEGGREIVRNGKIRKVYLGGKA